MGISPLDAIFGIGAGTVTLGGSELASLGEGAANTADTAVQGGASNLADSMEGATNDSSVTGAVGSGGGGTISSAGGQNIASSTVIQPGGGGETNLAAQGIIDTNQYVNPSQNNDDFMKDFRYTNDALQTIGGGIGGLAAGGASNAVDLGSNAVSNAATPIAADTSSTAANTVGSTTAGSTSDASSTTAGSNLGSSVGSTMTPSPETPDVWQPPVNTINQPALTGDEQLSISPSQIDKSVNLSNQLQTSRDSLYAQRMQNIADQYSDKVDNINARATQAAEKATAKRSEAIAGGIKGLANQALNVAADEMKKNQDNASSTLPSSLPQPQQQTLQTAGIGKSMETPGTPMNAIFGSPQPMAYGIKPVQFSAPQQVAIGSDRNIKTNIKSAKRDIYEFLKQVK